MPITPQDYNGDAILGEQLSKLMEKEIRDRLKGDVPETLAHALCVMAAEIDALKAALAASNLGERVADSLDAQTLKVGGEDVTDASNHTATFTQASSRTNLTTGEKLSAMFGKIAKWFADLKTVAFTGSYNDLSNKPNIPAGVIVDQTYSASSANAQSGTAVAGALATKQATLPTTTVSSTLYYQINVTGSAGAANRADGITCAAVQTPFDHSVYKVPVITSDGAAKWDGVPSGSTNSRLNYVFDENLLSVNISGNANGLSLGNVTTMTYTMPVCDGNGDAKSGPAVQKLANSYKVYADISGNAATATNASSVNGMKIERGAYGGVANTIYFC